MQVSIEMTSELSRKMTVHVPEDRIQEQVAKRLKSLAVKVKLDGFRPGKAPQSVINKRYGADVREEVLAELVQSTFNDAVREEKLKLVSRPYITPEATSEGEGLKYVADFEVLPEIILYPVEQMELERSVSEVTEDNIDSMLFRLREQRKTWKEISRPAELGDRITIHYEGRTDGESLTNGKVENFYLVLGSNTMIPGFEEALIGAVVGDRPNFNLVFPEDYGEEKLAGKTAEFSVEVFKLEQGVLPDLDKEFLDNFGMENGDVEAFRNEIRNSMEREMNRALASRNKDRVMEELLRRNTVLSLPSALVREELNSLIQSYKDESKNRGLPFDEASARGQFEPIAQRRVALGLLLNKFIETCQIKPDPGRVRATINDLALNFENPEEIVNWYYSNRDQLAQVQKLVMEDQVVDLILQKSKVNDQRIEFDDLMNKNPQHKQA